MSPVRMFGVAVVIEGLAILVLVGVVAVTGPGDPVAARAYAEDLGYWLGPLAGFVLCVGGGWLVSRRSGSRQVSRGLLLGAMVVGIDVTLLVASGATFQPILALSNMGRLVAGALGGRFAALGAGHGTPVG